MRYLALLIVFVLTACNTGTGAVTSGGDAGGDTLTTGDAAPDLGESDAVGFDRVTEDTGLDLVVPETSGDTTAPCDPGDGCFLDPCEENGDCLSGWCVEHMAEGLCSQACEEDCPAGWTCKLLGNSGPDPAYACVSDVSNLCKPCADNGDCQAPGGQEDVCVDYGTEGSFCGGGCEGDDDCPWGFTCTDTSTVDGIETVQCVADAGVCPCTAKSVTLALWTPCLTSSETGQCEGKRVCTEGGLTDCDAAVAEAELCNGLDDDCDGDVDEPTLDGGDLVNLCDDENPCTVDTCSGADGCTHEALDAGECIDGDPCTLGDHCEEGTCIGSLIDCDDNDPCTDDACDTLGGCIYEFNAADCDDGNACTVADECGDGSCAGVPVNCDCTVDADCSAFEDDDACNGTLYCDTTSLPYQCTVDSDTIVDCPPLGGDAAQCNTATCDPASGDCGAAPKLDGAVCDDGDPCTVTETCLQGTCQGGAQVNCNDGNPCTDDACAPPNGCAHTPNNLDCEDGNICSVGDVCDGGICSAGQTLECDDGNPCTADSCTPGVGCIHAPADAACDDGNACTLGDTCVGGACVYGELLACDDGNPCTTDSCDPAVGCAYTLNGAPCDDGDICTTGDHCDMGACIAGGALPCDDMDACTVDSCDPDLGCVSAAGDMDCGDMDGPCTEGACDPGSGDCIAIPANNDAPCDDEDACTAGDKCFAGACAGAAKDCDDGEVCTDDGCDADVGCTHTLNAAPCDDGDACTLTDTCSSGVCGGAGAPDCDDGNPCTDDSCDADLGCVNAFNTSPCDDGNACNVTDACNNGVCVGAGVVNCDDGNLCTDDYCDVDLGCQATNNTNPCDDGDPCTAGDICASGLCDSGADVLNCNDGVDCTADSCQPGVGCVNTAMDADCDDGVTCTADSCDQQLGCLSDPVDATCDDDIACTLDHCDAQSDCVNSPVHGDCTDGNICTDDSCDPNSGCVFINNTLPCPGGTCQGGSCVESGGTFQGFVTWSQTASSQSDAQQDAIMNAACASSHPGSHAASIDEIISGQITGLPNSNTSGQHLLGVCPNCAGTTYSGAVSGHARNCVDPGASWPTSMASGWNPWCHTSTRTAMCLF